MQKTTKNNGTTAETRTAEFSHALRMSYRYLSHQARSVYELSVYLKGKNTAEKTINAVIHHLAEHRYLDDETYCRQFVEYSCRYRPKSVYAMGYELKYKKGIADEIIQRTLSHCDDRKLAEAAVKKKISQWRDFDELKRKRKIFNFLKYRGFSYEICQFIHESIEKEELT